MCKILLQLSPASPSNKSFRSLAWVTSGALDEIGFTRPKVAGAEARDKPFEVKEARELEPALDPLKDGVPTRIFLLRPGNFFLVEVIIYNKPSCSLLCRKWTIILASRPW